MNRFVGVGAVLAAALGLGTAAQAADLALPTPQPVIAPEVVVETANPWSGFYIGVFAGWANATWYEEWVDLGGGNQTFNPSGFTFGLTAGVDVALGPLIIGLAGDIARPGINFELVDTYTGEVTWATSLRARAGIGAGKLLPYVTGGIAFAGVTTDYTLTSSNIHRGWTVGGGVELAVTDHLALDLQYRYTDLGTRAYNVGPVDYDITLTTHQVSLGLNVRF